MDSGNSGSMQSSSGGDEEYDSRAESISPFLNPSQTHYGSISSNPHPPPTFFDPNSSHNIYPFSHPPNPNNPNPNPNSNHVYNLGSLWSRNLRSDPAYTQLGHSPFLSHQGLSSSTTEPLTTSLPVDQGTAVRDLQQSDQPYVAKNPKKRTRASRRAPTTVLTTDTTNFRQMVQEFTGIPTAPFSRRFDLFGRGPFYPSHPSSHKVHLSPYVSSSSSSSTSFFANSSAIVDSIAPTSTTTTTNNYLELPINSQNMLNMQNPILNFQSLLQSQGSSRNLPFLAELGHGHVNLNPSGFPSHGGQENLGFFDENINGNSRNVGDYKLHTSSASAPDFRHEKG